MKVHLAGYNVDTTILKELEEKAGKRDDLTPEVISAAYARISRDPRSIEEIREDSRKEVERTRKSNSTIIFKMGHHSVAEHAVFNLDIIGVSRYVMEELEKFRLCSYTEKSQRYITLDRDFVIPEEIKGTELEKLFVETIQEQNNAYHTLYEKLKRHVFLKNKELAENPKKHNLLEGWAKEDARYITSLATESQVGHTINARNLELLLRRFASHPLSEVQALGRALYKQVAEVAPSVVIFHQANNRDQKAYPELKAVADNIFLSKSNDSIDISKPVELLNWTTDGDAAVAAALLHTSSAESYEKCIDMVKNLTKEKIEDIFKAAFKHMQFYDSMLRELEYADLTFNIVLSAACFGQLKRHRMSTITSQEYDPALGVTIPESIKEIGMADFFQKIIDNTNNAYKVINKTLPSVAPYILTNAHRKRVLMRLNARELYHISRLREDTHAQWDIQNIASLMAKLAREKMPLVFRFIGGKDKFNEIYQSLYGHLPAVTEAALPGTRKINI
jgi:flavin-dependent thymidylate synthase